MQYQTKFLLKTESLGVYHFDQVRGTMNTQRPNSTNDKRAYHRPVLTVYGTVWQLTQRIGRHGNSDSTHPFGLRVRTHA